MEAEPLFVPAVDPVLAELVRHRDWLRAELSAAEVAIESRLMRAVAEQKAKLPKLED